MPYDHGLLFQDGRPLIYDSGDFPASRCDKLKELVGWDDFAALPRARRRAEGRRVGLGIGCYVEGTGVGPYEGGHIQIETSGRVNVSTGLTSQGQGHQTVFAQIVAEELGVPLSDVHVTTGDTRRFGYAVGTFASRAAVMSGNAVALAARNVREKALRIAGEALEADPGDLEIIDGVVRVKGDPEASIALATVSVLSNPLRYAFDEAAKAATQFGGNTDLSKPPVAEDDEPGLEGKDYYSPPRATFANGMHAAIVETDPETAEITILRYCVIHDCGRVINPMIVEGQVHGGVAQGVGGALYERMAYDEAGQLLNASFMDFLMPYASEVPFIETDHLETPSPLNPLGIKGAGEAGCIPVTAVIASRHRGRRGLPDHLDADLAQRALGPAAPPRRGPHPRPAPRIACRRSPSPRRLAKERPDEGLRIRRPQRPRRAGLGGVQRPGRARPHPAGLPGAARGGSRRVQDDDHRGCRLHQGHLRGRRRPDPAEPARVLRAQGRRRRRARHGQRRRRGQRWSTPPPAARTSPTTPTPSSVA